MQEKSIVVYTDGGCKGNPGPGGWAYIMRFGERYREAWGGELQTTNNRMELTAVIRALSFLKERIDAARASCIRRYIPLPAWISTPIHIFTDSMYVKTVFQDGFTTGKSGAGKPQQKSPS
jgi:Ribonuclease HI